ncbi:hypothetical protein IKF15_00430 [Candidatus Saccharibacteria bacterium]|nr:hypothetical protein [Candidatus Saccharibacteria bacterium]
MKHIKGHTQILLTDVKTGKVEKIESDNLVTNAVKEFLSFWQPLLGWNAIATYFMPLWQKMYGGLYLFDTALTESAANTFLPNVADAKLTGYAGNATSGGEDTKRGSFNANESEALSNGYKFVWDFGTSEGNGTIAAACLTNPLAGYHGYNYDPYGALFSAINETGNTGANYKGMGWSANQDLDSIRNRPFPYFNFMTNRYVLEFEATSNKIKRRSLYYNGTNCTIGTAELKTNSMNIKDTYGAIVQTSETVSASGGYGGDGIAFDTGDKIIYLTTPNTQIIRITEFNRNTFEYETRYEIPFYTQTGKDVRGLGFSPSYYTDGGGAVYKNGFIYVLAFDSGDGRNAGYVAKINISTKEASIITPKFSQTARYGYAQNIMLIDVNGNILAGGYLIYGNDEYLPIESSNSRLYYNAEYKVSNYAYELLNSDHYNVIMPNLQYLATINNLATPVIKTASKTMKVTYTLTEAT